MQAESVTSTLVYTYTAGGLRVAQSVDGDASIYAWDWASGLPELLSEGGNLYLVGHETLGWWDGNQWAYILPDGLGSVRQVTDATGAVTDAREWTPYGEELDGAQAGLGYTGEWQDAALGLTYLRARWYDGRTGRFTRRDVWEGELSQPQSLHYYVYVQNDSIDSTDPTGLCTMCTQGSSVTVYGPGGIALRTKPSLDAPVIHQIPDLTRVMIREDAPVLDSGLDWHSSIVSLHALDPGAPYNVVGWLPNKSLLDDPDPSAQPVAPNDFGLWFPTLPVAIGSLTGVQGFGATQHAFNTCGDACEPEGEESDCDYRLVRGLHNGLDLIVPNGTIVYWTGSANGILVDMFPGDAGYPHNLVIQVGNYYVLFGHLQEILIPFNPHLEEPGLHPFVWTGMPIGITGEGHLHLGIRTTSKFYNPLYFFERTLAATLEDKTGEYIEDEGPWSMLAYEYNTAGYCGRYFWDCNGCNSDRTGIDRP